MNIEIIPCLNDNYSYLIYDKHSDTVAIIDPSKFEPCDEAINKNYKKLDFILNTHHHYDHVGGNQELKERYGASVIGYKGDKDRIPEIDTLVDDKEIWQQENFEAKIFHIPGHTLGHICFYFYNEESVFTGDTLFSLGCGKIFEGTYAQMHNSLMKLKTLPEKTKIYCGHEYTKQNSKFCITHDKDNQNLKAKIKLIDEKLKNNLPTIPSTIKEELECNIFLRSSKVETFSKLRDLKDNF